MFYLLIYSIAITLLHSSLYIKPWNWRMKHWHACSNIYKQNLKDNFFSTFVLTFSSLVASYTSRYTCTVFSKHLLCTAIFYCCLIFVLYGPIRNKLLMQGSKLLAFLNMMIRYITISCAILRTRIPKSNCIK